MCEEKGRPSHVIGAAHTTVASGKRWAQKGKQAYYSLRQGRLTILRMGIGRVDYALLLLVP